MTATNEALRGLVEYRVENVWTDNLMVVRIDWQREGMNALLHDINGFFSGADDRLDEAEGDITKAVLCMLARRVIEPSIYDLDIERSFLEGREEGWPPLDGSQGIALVSVEADDGNPEFNVESRAIEPAQEA